VASYAKQADDETPHHRALRISWRAIPRASFVDTLGIEDSR
jgi:hypothetical protein